MALMLEVKEGESISFDDGRITATVAKLSPHRVRLSIEAPLEVHIGRPYNRLNPPAMSAGRLSPPVRRG